MIGSSPKTKYLQKEIRKVAKSTSTVLIAGESGTGKEIVASAIWKASERRNNRFIALNCGAIPEPLLESELFGYVKGAFTGADPNGRIGKFELANKGVIFLDEIGDMPLYLQVKLLRVLQERKIIRIGSNQVIPIDVRIIAATNKNLKEMIEKKQFREDLYYRLNVIPLKIAPLRERKEDIQDLVLHFAGRYAGLFGKKLVSITEEVMECMCRYPWYGNVRELENSVEFMVNMMEEDGILDQRTLPDNLLSPQTKEQGPSVQAAGDKTEVRCLKELEGQEIRKALQLFGADTKGKKEAAKALGISLATLYRKLEEMEK
ncbi:MAG: sigma 54-interacting transcriptional regulator [Lachnospiraceae bacterium]|nr:sigma 54-interacting transcriptional regulator [Lachnospiraceae bacterium]